MDALFRAAMQVRASRPAFGRLVCQTSAVIREWLDVSEHPCVAFSGGKDSSVMLYLIRALRPDTPAMYGDDEYVFPETKELVATTPNVFKTAGHIQHSEWFTAWDDRSQLPADREWVESVEFKSLTAQWLHNHGYDGIAVGLRAEENPGRRIGIKTYGQVFFAQAKKLWTCWPLAYWKTDDIWTAIVYYNIPYNRAYDRMFELGVPRNLQRIGPFGNHKAVAMGQMTVIKRGWPELYNRFYAAHPDAGRYL